MQPQLDCLQATEGFPELVDSGARLVWEYLLFFCFFLGVLCQTLASSIPGTIVLHVWQTQDEEMLNLNKALLDLIMAGLHGKSIRAGGWLWALECGWLLLAGQPRKTSLGFAFCLLCESGNPKWCRTRHFLLTGSKRQALLFSPSEAARHGQEILIRTSSFVTTRCLALSPRPKVTWCSLAQRGSENSTHRLEPGILFPCGVSFTRYWDVKERVQATGTEFVHPAI